MLTKNRMIVLIGLVMILSLACTLSSTAQTEVPVSQTVEAAPTQQENPTAEPTLQPTAAAPRSNKGQIAYVMNGNIFVQNLETNAVQQLTRDADAAEDFLHVYHSITFSDSGRYLAFEYGHPSDGTTTSYVYEISNFTQIARLDGEMLMGWLWGEDNLRVGHNDQQCQDGMTEVDNKKISFEVYDVSALSGSKSALVSIPGGYLWPTGVGTKNNWMYFQDCPCDYYECLWRYPVYLIKNDQAVEINVQGAVQDSPDGGRPISISYSIHQPETAGLEITDQNGENSLEIYREEGKYIQTAQWAPRDDWIVFTIADTQDRAWQELRMIRPDGSDQRTIVAEEAYVIDWMPGGETMILMDAGGSLQTYYLETGATETLTNLGEVRSVSWSLLP